MWEKIKSCSFTLSCLIILFLYHGYNVINQSRFAKPKDWISIDLGFEAFKKTWFRFSLPSPIISRKIDGIDASSQELKNLGHAIHFLMGRVPGFMFKGPGRTRARLYLREEIPWQFSSSLDSDSRENYRQQIQKLTQSIETSGISLVILPIPTKISMERKFLGEKLPQEDLVSMPGRKPNERENPREVYQSFVTAAPGNTVDLYSLYQKHLELNPETELYLPAASHWSSRGISLAAEGILSHLISRGFILTAPKMKYENKWVPNYDMDLIRALQLPPYVLFTWPLFQWFEPIYFIPPVETYNDTGKRIFIAGSCYSHRLSDQPYGLGPVLAKALKRLFIDISVLNGSSIEPLKRLVYRKWVLQKGDILIWEFPIRKPPGPEEQFPIPLMD